jgi:hypothetical protein
MIRKALGTIIGGVLALALLSFVPQARAEGQHEAIDQVTRFTFNQPVQLPHNKVLPAGTYWFTVPDAQSGGQTVQVLNADRTRVLGTFETIATDRPDLYCQEAGCEDARLTMARLPNQVPLLVSWTYPGESQGHEFVYSRQTENQLSETGKFMTVQIPIGGTVTVG